MLDKRMLNNTEIYKEFDEVESNYWFDLRQKKFLHNIDTFYYSVKFKQDFTRDSIDSCVKQFRKYFSKKYEEIDNYNEFAPCYFDGLDVPLKLYPFNFAGRYTICLRYDEYYDIYFAPVVPHSNSDGPSVTCECVVQLRSYYLWMYGVKYCYEQSLNSVKAIAYSFGLTIEFTQENRIDYCWHTNYLQKPEEFFEPNLFHKMRVDRFKDSFMHFTKVGSEGFETDYVSMGKRSDKVFIRIYMKSKEVVEKGYKGFFFKVWLFNGLINRYDLYCYEHAYVNHSWSKLNEARIKFYLEYGRNMQLVDECKRILNQEVTYSADKLKAFADAITPKVTLVLNVEFQTMRKHTKSYELIPFKDNTIRLESKRIYDYLDNEKIICDYLTTHVFRMVEPTGDENKSRRDLCAFWKALKMCKIYDCVVPDTERELTRNYQNKLNSEIVKQRFIKNAVTHGLYMKGINDNNLFQDLTDLICRLNDNDVYEAMRFKKRKISHVNENELADLQADESCYSSNIVLMNNATGEIYMSNYNHFPSENQDKFHKEE